MPLKVISLLPSATEMLASIIEKQPKGGRFGPVTLVGRSHECDFPAEFVKDVPKLTTPKTRFNPDAESPARDIEDQVRQALSTGTSLYNLETELVKELNPDVVLTQSLCDVCSIDMVTVERIVKRMKMPANVLDLNAKTLEQVVADITRVGEAIGCEEGALEVTQDLNRRIQKATKTEASTLVKVGFFEWTDPVYAGGHWTPQIIGMAGGIHLLNDMGTPSTPIHDAQIAEADPDLLIIAPCGIDLVTTRNLVTIIEKDPKRGEWFRALRAYKTKKIVLVDGNEMFNRPGPRLVDALEFCRAIFDSYATLAEDAPFTKDVVPFKFPWEPYFL